MLIKPDCYIMFNEDTKKFRQVFFTMILLSLTHLNFISFKTKSTKESNYIEPLSWLAAKLSYYSDYVWYFINDLNDVAM